MFYGYIVSPDFVVSINNTKKQVVTFFTPGSYDFGILLWTVLVSVPQTYLNQYKNYYIQFGAWTDMQIH